MKYYDKAAEERVVMERWCEAVLRAGAFYQQMDPQTGDFTKPDPGGYSPCALAFLHFAKGLGRAPSKLVADHRVGLSYVIGES
jgi:hypothetical protein